MAPGTAQPLHRVAIALVSRDPSQCAEDVVRTHHPQAVQERAGVFQHNPRLETLVHQLRNELAHALVTPQEYRRIMVVPDVGVLQHPLQIANQRRRTQITTPRGDERLMHMQSDSERAVDVAEARPIWSEERWIGMRSL